MADYTIQGIASEVRDWNSAKGGPMKSYKLKLSGVSEPVEWNRKADSPAPKVNETISGTVETSQYGLKFKMDYQGGGSAGGRSGGYQKDEKAIQAMWSIGQAVQCLSEEMKPKASLADIEANAQQLFEMVGRVKVVGNAADSNPDTVAEVVDGEPVTLDDDPFAGFDFGSEEEKNG